MNMQLKHFKQEGNIYNMKPQYGFSILLIAGLLLFAFVAYYVDIYGLMWVLLLLSALCFWAVATKKLSIDISRREVYAKVGLAKPPVTLSIDRIQRFELFTMSNGYFKSNAMLSAYYLDEHGEEKAFQIAQGFTIKAMQSILNELEEIISNEHDKR